MDVLIVCFSLTGNTTKIAHAIQQEVAEQGHRTELKRMGEVTAAHLDAYDLVFLGAACHDSDLAQPAKRLLDEIGSRSGLGDAPPFKLAGFVTHATKMPDEGERWRALYEHWTGACLPTFQQVCEEKQIPFLGFYHCQGKPSAPIEAFIHDAIVTDEAEWVEYIAEARTHPNQHDLARARAFARQVLEAC